MRAILLAAGKGTRISRMVKAVPKSTLPIDGVPLIRIIVTMLLKEKFDVSVCVGYQKEKVYEALEGLDVEFYHNPFFDVTNSIASLWFARDLFDGKDDLLILNADVFFSKKILDKLLNDERETVMLVDRTRTKTGDYFFSTTSNGCINAYGKDLPLQKRKCEYVGLAKIKSSFVQKFKERMVEMIDSQKHSMWWENVLYSFTDNCENDIFTLDVDGLFWSEIDYFDDYERILSYIAHDNRDLEE